MQIGIRTGPGDRPRIFQGRISKEVVMKLSTLFLINGIVALLFGLGFVLIPGTVVSWYGVTLDEAATYISRLYGSALLGFAIISFMVRNATGSGELRAILAAFAFGDLLGFVLSLIYQLQGVANTLGWTTVVIYLALGVAFGAAYMRQRGAG
jgi:hypothetical protein